MIGTILLILAAIPLIVVFPTPLEDWPSHLARVHILRELRQGGDIATSGFWARYYQPNSFLLPNVVLDVVLLGLLSVGLSLKLAAAVFLLLTYAVFVSGFCRLAAACGSGGWEKALLGALIFFNGSLFWGFVNFLFGLGVLMGLLGMWIGAAERWQTRLAIAVGGTVLLFFCHVVPVFLFAGLLGLFELDALWQSRRQLGWSALRHGTGAAALAVAVTLLLLSATGQGGAFELRWTSGGTPMEFARSRIATLAKAPFGGAPISDLVLIVGGGVCFGMALWLARVRLSRPATLAMLALTLLMIVAPQRVGAGSFFDFRIGVFLVVFGLACAQFNWRNAWARSWFLAALMIVLLARAAALGSAWVDARRVYDNLETALAFLPPGSILLTAKGTPDASIGWRVWWQPPIGNIGSLLAFRDVFVPSVFAHPKQQPLALRPAWRPWDRYVELTSPAALQAGLAKADALCAVAPDPSGPVIALLLLHPQPWLESAAAETGVERIGERFALLQICLAKPVP